MSNKKSQETAVGVFVLAGIACIIYLSVNLGDMEFFGTSSYNSYKARFLSVQGLKENGNVVLAGVRVGAIERIYLDKEDYSAMVQFKVRKDIDLFDDAIASVKTNGLIGDRYLGIDPGGSGALLAPGEIIYDTESALDIESLVGKTAFGDVKD